MIKKIESCVYFNAENNTEYSIKSVGKDALITKTNTSKKLFNKEKKRSEEESLRNLDIFFERYDFEFWNSEIKPGLSFIKVEYNGSFYYLSADETGENEENIFSDIERYFSAYYDSDVKSETIRCHSFDGGGPEYEFITEVKGVFTWYGSRFYSHPGHDKICGAGYDVIYKLYPLRKGTASALINSSSPIVPPESRRVIVEVDDELNIKYRFEKN